MTTDRHARAAISLLSLGTICGLGPGAPVAQGQAAPAPALTPGVPPTPPAVTPEPQSAPLSIVQELGRQSWMISPHLESEPALRFLEGVTRLPEPEARTLWRSRERRVAYTPEQYASLPEAERADLTSREFSPSFFYNTAYGSPLVYARVLDIASKHGLKALDGKRVLDFGYGSIGQIRLLALAGADAHGVDVEAALAALYSFPGDTGTLGSGSVTLHHGRWPAEPAIVEQVGAGYDLITSKNTLKAGYIHPAREADPAQLVTLGVDDGAFLAAVHDALKPGGIFIIYNICPPQNPEPGSEGATGDTTYIPFADGWSPFSEAQFLHAGLEVLAFDIRDEAALHPIFLALGYDNGRGMEALKESIFVWYTVVRRID